MQVPQDHGRSSSESHRRALHHLVRLDPLKTPPPLLLKGTARLFRGASTLGIFGLAQGLILRKRQSGRERKAQLHVLHGKALLAEAISSAPILNLSFSPSIPLLQYHHVPPPPHNTANITYLTQGGGGDGGGSSQCSGNHLQSQ